MHNIGEAAGGGTMADIIAPAAVAAAPLRLESSVVCSWAVYLPQQLQHLRTDTGIGTLIPTAMGTDTPSIAQRITIDRVYIMLGRSTLRRAMDGIVDTTVRVTSDPGGDIHDIIEWIGAD